MKISKIKISIKDFLDYLGAEYYPNDKQIYIGNESFGINFNSVNSLEKTNDLSELILISFFLKKLTTDTTFMSNIFNKTSYYFVEVTLDYYYQRMEIDYHYIKKETINLSELKPIFKSIVKNKNNIKKTYTDLFHKQFPVII